MWARSVCGCRAGVATGKGKLLGVICIEEWPDHPKDGKHCHDDAGKRQQEIGVGCEPVVVGVIEIILIENSQGRDSIPEDGWGQFDGIGCYDVDPDEEQDYPEDYPRVLIHGWPALRRFLIVLCTG